MATGMETFAGSEKGQLVFPIETTRRNRRVREPEEGDVVEDIVSCQASGLPVKGARDEFVAARVVVQQIGREANG